MKRRRLKCDLYLATFDLIHLITSSQNYAFLKVKIYTCFDDYFKSILYHLITMSLLVSTLINQLAFGFKSIQFTQILIYLRIDPRFVDLQYSCKVPGFIYFMIKSLNRLDSCLYYYYLNLLDFTINLYYEHNDSVFDQVFIDE